MNKYLTIYFDTYFYVWLAKATDEEADEIISQLNKSKVRHVLSGQVILELLSNSNKPEKDKVLVNRVSKFEIEPYIISSSILEESLTSDSSSWKVLLLEGDLRTHLATSLKLIFDLQAQAESWSTLAKTKQSVKKEEKIQESLAPFLSSIGFEKDKEYSQEETAEKYVNFTSELLSSLSDEQRKFAETINFSEKTSPESLANLSNQLLSIIGDENIEKLKEGEQISYSVTNSDERPYKVAVKEASQKEEKNLGNSFRDSNNMSLFVIHQDEIDLLQIDSAQMNQIKNKGKKLHRIVELKLDSRCFCANSLKNTIEVIKKKKQELSL